MASGKGDGNWGIEKGAGCSYSPPVFPIETDPHVQTFLVDMLFFDLLF